MALVAGIAQPADVPSDAGRLQFATGDVQILSSDRRTRTGSKGDAVREGDTISTGNGAAAQIVMSDGGIIAMRSGTQLVIQQFRFSGKDDGSESSVLSLLKGGFRTITGIIGRRNRDNYRVQTSTATIGIRGTDHEVYHIPPPLPGEQSAGEPGTYNRVNSGETYLRTEQGTTFVGPNQIAYAAPKLAPQILKTTPGFLLRAFPMPQGRIDIRPQAMRAEAALDNVREALAPLRQIDGLARPLALIAMRDQYCTNATDCAVVQGPGAASNGLIEIPAQTGGVGGEVSTATGIGIGTTLIDGVDSVAVGNASGQLVLLSDRSGFRYGAVGATSIEVGGANANGTAVRWGIYAGGAIFEPSTGAHVPAFFHYMMATNYATVAQLSVPGTASMGTTVGYTKPIDEQGRVGGSASLTVGLVYGAVPRVQSYQLDVADAAGRAWQASLVSPQTLLSMLSQPSTPNLAVSCSGACGSRTGVGIATGIVAGGANRDVFISSYALKSGTAAVTGSVATKK